LTDFLEEYSQDEQVVELPEFKEMRVERKRFYFDCGSNDRGAFLRISEVILINF
jgi:PurA ssDNA and RNA-binding protein.